jgi:hypothetical protein
MICNVNIVIGVDAQTRAWLSGLTARFGSKLDLILANQEKIMASLDETLDKVTEADTADDSIIALLQGLRDQIATGGLSAADQAKVDAIFAKATSSVTKINAALAANVPPAE